MVPTNGMKNATVDAVKSVFRSSANQTAIGSGRYAEDLQLLVSIAEEIVLAK